MEFEKMGIPAVTFVTDWFKSLANTIKKGGGLPDLNLVVVPHPFDSLSEQEAIAIADGVLDQAIAAITTKSLVHVSKQATLPR